MHAGARFVYWWRRKGAVTFSAPVTGIQFTITSGIAGQGYWYNRRGGSTTGSVTGILKVEPDWGDINRFGTSSGDLLINKQNPGAFSTWSTENPGFAITLTFPDQTNDPTIVLTASELDGNPGGGFIRFSLTADQITIINNISTGSAIEVHIDPTP